MSLIQEYEEAVKNVENGGGIEAEKILLSLNDKRIFSAKKQELFREVK